jgi:hypothetical protein
MNLRWEMSQTKLYYRIGTFINIGIPQKHITAASIANVFEVAASKGDVLIHETDWGAIEEGAVLWFVIDLSFASSEQDWLVAELIKQFDVLVDGSYTGG